MTFTDLPARPLTFGEDGEMFELLRAIQPETLTIRQQVELGSLLMTLNALDGDDTLDDAGRWRSVAQGWRRFVATWLDAQ